MKKWVVAFLLCLGLVTNAEAQLSQTNWGPATVDAQNEELKFTDLRGMGSASVQIIGTWSMTFTPACSNDSGTTWDAVRVFDGTGTAYDTVTANGRYTADVSGCQQYRFRATAVVSGSATLNGIAKPVAGGAAGGGGSVTIASGTVTVDNLVQDAIVDQPKLTTGPQMLGACETTTFTTVTDGDAQYIRTNCTTGAMYVMLDECTPGSFIGGASVNETALKATAGRLVHLSATSLDATPVYLKLYNDTTANIDETDTPVFRFGVPANATAALGSGTINLMPPGGMNFSTAITIRTTTGITDNSTGALTADEVLVSYCVI